MIFLFQGSTVHAVVNEHMIDRFDLRMHEGDFKFIRRFHVEEVSGVYRPSRNRGLILFLSNTSVRSDPQGDFRSTLTALCLRTILNRSMDFTYLFG